MFTAQAAASSQVSPRIMMNGGSVSRSSTSPRLGHMALSHTVASFKPPRLSLLIEAIARGRALSQPRGFGERPLGETRMLSSRGGGRVVLDDVGDGHRTTHGNAAVTADEAGEGGGDVYPSFLGRYTNSANASTLQATPLLRLILRLILGIRRRRGR